MKKGNWKKRLLAVTLCAGLVFQSFPAEASAAIPAEEAFRAAEEDAYLSADEMSAEDMVSEVGEMPEEDVLLEDSEKPENDIALGVGETPTEDAVPEDGEIPEENASLAAGMDGEAALLQEAEAQVASSSVPAGKGTEKNPYLITNEEELGMISNASDAHWKLAGDIILEKEFAPIPEFSGTLDGDGYRICGTIGSIITKEPVFGVAYEVRTGLIKENKGTIKNLCLEVEISSSLYGLGGGFLAYENQNGGLIENCCISGKLHIVERDQNYGYYNFNAAGAVYSNEGTIRNCYAKIRIDGGCRRGPDIDINVGGFLGRLYGTGTVENCYSVSDSFGDYEGCFLLNDDGNGTIKSCYYDGDTITDEYMYTDGSGYYARHTGAMKWQPNYKGWDFDKVWAIDAAVNDGYPYLRCQRSAEPQGTLPSTLAGKGTEKDPYLITSEGELEMVGGASDAYWKLACDIILEKKFTQLPEFGGTLDGDGYRICGETGFPPGSYGFTYEAGLTRKNTGTIKNLCLEAEQYVTGGMSLRGSLIAHENYGLIENCAISGKIHVTHDDRWNAHWRIGGCVFHNEGTIRNCYARVNLEGYLTSYPLLYDRGDGIGAFLGINGENGIVENCYSASTATGGTDTEAGCFMAQINSNDDNKGTIKNCYYDGELIHEGQYMSTDGSGYYARHTSTMKEQTNYEGWDFDKIWAIDPAANDGYPYLRSQKSVIVKPQDIVLDRKEIYLVEEAEPFQLHASIIPGNVANKNITWSSSDKYVASVDEKNGTVTPLAEGETTITATTEEGGLTASCKVNVIRADDKTPYVAEVIVSPSQAELKPGEECQFKAEVKGINNPGTGVQWAVSENKSISTTITSGGFLKVAENESAEEFTVTAMSAADSSKKTSVKVTVLQQVTDPEQPYVYEALPDGTMQINKYKGNDTQIEVPDKIDGKEVSVIGENAFQGLENITSVKLPESIRKVGSGAFAWCTGLASVNLPAEITELAETTFYGCAALKTVSLPEGVTSVGDYAFYDCTVLNNIYLPGGVTSIGDYAFYGCSGLKKIAYGGNESQWKQIQVGEENGCLTQAEVAYGSKAPEPEDPEDPGKGDADPASYEYELLSDGTVKIKGYKGIASKLSIPEEIGGEKVSVLGENAFQGLENITSVYLPDSIEEMESGVFANCTGLVSVKLPAKITEIAETAFYGCAALASINVPDGVTEIGNYAFYGCTSLDNIYLPASLKLVGAYAFYECSGLKKVAYGGSKDQWNRILVGVENECLQKAEPVCGSKMPDPEYPDPGEEDKDPASYEYETLSDGTVKIKGYKGTASKLSIPEKIGGEKVSVIGENAFQGLENITSVYLPDSIEEIESGAFANCTGLVSVKLPAKITKIAETAFYGCAALASVNVPDGVREIEDYAFYGCTSLDNIYLPASLKLVGAYAFYECSGLKKVSYGGSQNQWKQMQIGIENECLQKAEVAYNSKMPEPGLEDPDDPDDPDNPGEEDNTSEVLPEDIPYIPEPQFRSGFWGVTTEKQYIYTRKAIKPEVHVYYRENLGGGSYVDRMAEEGLDYTLSYKNNVKASRMYEASAGQSYVVVTGKNLYKGKTGKITFVIQPAPLKNVQSGDVAVVYNGKEQKKLPSLSYNGKKLSYKKDISKTDFTVSWPDISKSAYVEPGTYEMVLTGRNNFTGELKVKLVITSRDRLISKASAKISAQPYDGGKQVRPQFDVRLKGITLVNNKDYRVIYQNNTQIGTATAVIYGIYPYGGVKRVNFKITGISLKKAQVSYAKQMLYDGSDQVQDNLKVTMPYAPAPLVNGQDYEVTYSKNKNAGKATFTITGINQYTGQIKKTFKIIPRSVDELQGLDQEISAGPESLESGKYKPKPRLSFNGKKLLQGRDYTVSYKNNKIAASRVKQPMITIKGKGNFKGSRTIKFTIKK